MRLAVAILLFAGCANGGILLGDDAAPQQSGGALADIPVPSQPYDGIRIDVFGDASWVAIDEIAFTTVDCP